MSGKATGLLYLLLLRHQEVRDVPRPLFAIAHSPMFDAYDRPQAQRRRGRRGARTLQPSFTEENTKKKKTPDRSSLNKRDSKYDRNAREDVFIGVFPSSAYVRIHAIRHRASNIAPPHLASGR